MGPAHKGQIVVWEVKSPSGHPLTQQQQICLVSPSLMCRGSISVGISASLDRGIDREGTSLLQCTPSCSGTKRSKAVVWDSWAVGLDCGSRNLPVPLGWGQTHRHRRIQHGHGPSEEVIETLSLWSGHGKFHLLEAVSLPSNLPQVKDSLPPAIEKWPDTAGTHPEKKSKKDQVAPNMVISQDREWSTKQNRREWGLKDQIPGQVAFEPCSLLT